MSAENVKFFSRVIYFKNIKFKKQKCNDIRKKGEKTWKKSGFYEKRSNMSNEKERKNRQKSTNHDQRMKKTGAIKKKNVE